MQEMWTRIGVTAVLFAVVAIFCYLVEKRCQIREKDGRWQLFVGVLFGVMAVAAMAASAGADGNVDNVQDMAPLLAGLLFGVPAGILAGVFGAAGRLMLLPALGGHLCYAAAVSLVAAGLFAAFLRRFLFDDKKASAWYGLLTGFLMAICHVMVYMMMHIQVLGFAKTYRMVQDFLLPLALGNGLGLGLAMGVIVCLGKEKVQKHTDHKGLAQIFQRWLLLCIIAAYSITCVYTWFVQTQMALVNVENTLRLNINDLQEGVLEASDKRLLGIARMVAEQITPDCYVNENEGGLFRNHYLMELKRAFNLTDINLYNAQGINVASTEGEFCGYNMASGAQSAEFLVLLYGAESYVQRYQPISSDTGISRKYAGLPLKRGFLQVGYDAAHFHGSLQTALNELTHHRHIWGTGGIIIADEDGRIVSDTANHAGSKLSAFGIEDPRQQNPFKTFETSLEGTNVIAMYNTMEGYTILTYITKTEAMAARNFSFSIMIVMELLLFSIIFLLVYFLVKTTVVDNIHRINDSLEKITGGNLNVKVAVHSNAEFTSLSEDINSTVERLKQYIAEAAARIDKELEFAQSIQHASLPSVFPPYPERREFEIFATMDTAKEVGGDFYDFYLLGEKRLAFLIADVSGKGIPAALFMMKAKTLIKSLAESGLPVAEVFMEANEKLCEGNDTKMFVTAWLGVLDTETGLVEYVNAGHNPPIVVQDGTPVYLKMKAGLMLGAMEGVPYMAEHIRLAAGDMIFLYTDGLVEAIDEKTEEFGKERALQMIWQQKDAAVDAVLPAMKDALDIFVGAAEQFDDITMLGLRYKGPAVRGEAQAK